MSDQEKRDEYLLHWQKTRKGPYFDFQEMPASERLEFEMLSEENYLKILEIFQGEENPFFMNYYSDNKALEQYKMLSFEYGRYSSNHAGCDWLVKLKDTNIYIGILHLYEMSLETFLDRHKRCTIGFAFSQQYRRQRYGTEAVQHFACYVFDHFKMKCLLAYTDKKNEVSIAFMQQMGFIQCDEKYSNRGLHFFELTKDSLVSHQ